MFRVLDFLFPPRDDEKIVRESTALMFLELMNPRLVDYTTPATVALFSFSDVIVRAAIHEAKYHGTAHAFDLLGTALIEYLSDLDDSHASRGRACIIPIPLGKARLKERGFNQVEITAKKASDNLKMPLETDLLVRTRETVSQVSLPRDTRRKNMQGAFEAKRSADPLLTYVLIDDVITTGATLQSAIDALKKAGALHIIPLALAH